MTLKEQLKQNIIDAVMKLQNEDFVNKDLNVKDLVFNITQPNVPDNINIDQVVYDFSTNIAFILKNHCAVKNPIEVANKLVTKMSNSNIYQKIDIAVPGFINIVLSNQLFLSTVQNINLNPTKYGADFINKEHVNVEFVSANPTGFLHVGHARGAAYGDSLIRILRHAGYDVEAEYYVNDAGNQINVLTNSVYVRYQNLFGIDAQLPEDCYRGQDVVWCATKIKEKYGDYFLNADEVKLSELSTVAKDIMLDKIREDLGRLNVSFDTFASEKAIKEDGLIESVLKKLSKYTYTEDGALFLKTKEFGDDKDRVLIKADGNYTYFLPDIAYHELKFQKSPKLINIWGADHSGYIQRMKIAMQCLGYNPDNLDILTIQLVRLIKDGEEFKMSKRAGTAVTLQDLLDYSSADAVRFMMLTREINNKFDFDIDAANSTDVNNPVFIVQYAHSRSVSLLNRLKQEEVNAQINFTNKAKKLIIELDSFPELIKTIVSTSKVNLLTQYLINLAKSFNSFYAETKLLGHEDEATYAHLIKSVQAILALGLNLIGVSAPLSM
ncbi:arginine--tRNA ligase [Mycoplasma sp. 21DD0573]|uniref:arginine--tRNA ligase n=1 Tax=unclassified Mycoplasma TaxID=2683645 RepID=UPI002B1D8BB2|nr:arginine--tRNA ligase [Mycoplasma sp. 21DD0573]MEA4276403.1 arginine--tRNA ligase [Mycoplasma sp. 21DD0573]